MAKPPDAKTVSDFLGTLSLGALLTAIVGYFGKRLGFFGEKRKAEASEKIAEINAEAEVIKTIMAQCVSLMNTLLGSVRDMHNAHNPTDKDRAIEQMRDNLDHWKFQVEQAQDEKVILAREKDTLTKQVEALTQQVKALAERVREQATHIEKQDTELEQLRAENTTIKARLAELESTAS
jgi:chromosome segregation ATPase